MKRLALLLSVMVCFFGSCQLYAAPSKAGTVGYWLGQAIRHKWSWWVILLIVFVGIGLYVGDKKKKE